MKIYCVLGQDMLLECFKHKIDAEKYIEENKNNKKIAYMSWNKNQCQLYIEEKELKE